MSRYIDADELKRNHMFYHEADNRSYAEERDIDETPTVDAVQVVRCRECKWAEVDAWWTYCKLGHKEDTTNSIIYTCTHDFYCADGERKDGERRTE